MRQIEWTDANYPDERFWYSKADADKKIRELEEYSLKQTKVIELAIKMQNEVLEKLRG